MIRTTRSECVARAVRWLALTGPLFITALCLPVLAQDMTELLQILKDKGILTEEEFKKITDRQKIQRDSNREETKFRASEAAKEEIKAATKDDVKGSFRDGITFESADKKHALSIRGRAELDYRYFPGSDGLNANTFDLRRAYLSAEGRIYDNFEYRVRGNFSTLNGPTTTVCTAVGVTSATDPTPRCTQTAAVANTSNTSLDEAWLNINWWKAAQFKFGQFKMPYSLEQMQSELFTDFMERSMGDAISPSKERGAQVWGYPIDGLYYAVAYSNGQGINANETNNIVDGQDLLARVTVNIPELFANNNFVAHLGGSYSGGRIPVGSAFTGRTEARGIQFFAPDAFTGNDVDRTRYGLEGALAFGPVKFQAEYMRAGFSGRSAASATAVATDFDKDINAYYASLVWMITGESYAERYRNGLFGRPRVNNNFGLKAAGWGAWELGLRYSKFDASDFQKTTAALVGSGVIPANATNQADAWTLGLKWLPNPNVRLMLNYIETKFDTPIVITNTGRTGVTATTDKERAVTFRAQVDF
jgi:phosphate-selective porin OprO and OprP